MLFALVVDRYVGRTALFTPNLSTNLQRTVEPRPLDHKVELGRRRVRGLRAQSLPFESRRPFGPGPGALWKGGGTYCPNLKALAQHGVNYLNSSTSKPSDSFPGLMAIISGG